MQAHRDYVIKVLLKGLTGPLDGKTYTQVMIPMGDNSDAWIAGVASYVRTSFGNVGGTVTVADTPTAADVVLDVLGETRQTVVVGLSAVGQVTEFELRMRFRFRLRTRQGREVIPDAEIALSRDISFTESAALAKEAEEQLLFRDMQADIVLQTMRRLAAAKLA